MNKLYTKTAFTDLTYVEAYKYMKKGFFATRPEWDGFHFSLDRNYYILTKERTIIENPSEVYDEIKTDWMLVNPTDEAMLILNQNNIYLEE